VEDATNWGCGWGHLAGASAICGSRIGAVCRLLKSFDLSNLIPSSMDFLGSIGSSLIDNVIQQATQQVCQVLNNQLQDIVGKINGQMFDFNSLMGSQMSDLLGGSGSSISPINIPNLPKSLNRNDRHVFKALRACG
jgi:hypothetical protein